MKNATGFRGFSAFRAYNKVCFHLFMIRHFNYEVIDQSVTILALKSCETLEEFKEIAESLTTGILKPVVKTPSDAIREFKKMSDEQKRSALIEALTYCDLSRNEILALLYMQDDPNGNPWDEASINNLSPEKVTDIIVEVMIEFSKLSFDFGVLNDRDYEILKGGRVSVTDEVSDIIAGNEKIGIESLLPIAVKRVLKKIFDFKQMEEGKK